MYNRYIRSDNGRYTRIPEESGPSPGGPPPGPPPPGPPHHGAPPPGGPPPGGPPPGPPPHGPGCPPNGPPSAERPQDSLTGFLRRLLDQLRLDHVDTGDLLLLALLFFLFREDADEELLVALGLLLIL